MQTTVISLVLVALTYRTYFTSTYPSKAVRVGFSPFYQQINSYRERIHTSIVYTLHQTTPTPTTVLYCTYLRRIVVAANKTTCTVGRYLQQVGSGCIMQTKKQSRHVLVLVVQMYMSVHPPESMKRRIISLGSELEVMCVSTLCQIRSQLYNCQPLLTLPVSSNIPPHIYIYIKVAISRRELLCCFFFFFFFFFFRSQFFSPMGGGKSVLLMILQSPIKFH